MTRTTPSRRRWVRAVGVVLAVGLLSGAVLVVPFRWIAPPTTAFVLRDHFERGGPATVEWTPRSRIASTVAMAVVAAEDQKFPDHHGFDLQSIASAVQDADGRGRGASTITQQVAKNLYLWPGRSLVRKAIEAYLTLWIELTWPKGRILEVYLNVAEFGPGAFGVARGSRAAFGVAPGELSLEHASLLAAVLPSPRRMSAREPSDYVRQRAAEIREAVEGLGGPAYLRGL